MMGLVLGVSPVMAEQAGVAADLPKLNLMFPAPDPSLPADDPKVKAALGAKKAWEEWVGLEMGDGPYRDLYKPIPMHMYIAPTRHYIRPDMSGFADLMKKFKPDQCEECHLEVNPGWVHQVEDSAHGNPRRDAATAAKTAEIEKALGRKIDKVGCAECHGSSHDKLQMPYLDNACGHCHKQQAEEFVSEKKDGRPSHYASWESEVVPPWYIEAYRRGDGVSQIGCDICHPEMQRCDGCHMRHRFDASEARQAETCGKCHMGYDHPDYETYEESAMGAIYHGTHHEWNLKIPMDQVVPGKDWQAPTCAYCHMYQGGGKWGHNVTSKAIWRMGVYKPKQRNYEYKSSLKDAPYGINIPPLNRVIDLDSPDNKAKREKWVELCSRCHSPRFARIYLTNTLDEYMLLGWQKTDAAQIVVDQLFRDGCIIPTPENRDPFYIGDVIADKLGPEKLGPILYPAFKEKKGYIPVYGPILGTGHHYVIGPGNPSAVELELETQWFGHFLKGYKGVAHAQQDYAWWYGWSPMIQSTAKIQNMAVELRRQKAVEDKLGLKADGTLPSDHIIYGSTPVYTQGVRKAPAK
jgi:hypothetical protein